MSNKNHPSSITCFTLPNTHSDDERKIWVYLPPDYSSNTRYPVMYVQDGQHFFGNENEKYSWAMANRLKLEPAKIILVGIAHGKNRIDEMTPFANENHEGGNANSYLDFIINTVKPHIDNHYTTRPEATFTTIFGSSIGGLFSFYAALKRPDVFGNAIVFSPSFWFSEEIYNFAKALTTITTRMYLMAGDRESLTTLPNLSRMEAIIGPKTTTINQIVTKIVHNGQHNQKLWRKEFTNACNWLTEY